MIYLMLEFLNHARPPNSARSKMASAAAVTSTAAEAQPDEQPELPWWSRTYAGYRERFVEPYELQLDDGNVVLSLEQAPCVSAEHAREAKASADGSCTASTVWDAGIVLATCVYQRHRSAAAAAEEDAEAVPRRSRCLDLGSGTGIVGLAAAASGGFSRVVLTDLPSVVPLLERNVASNRERFGGSDGSGTETTACGVEAVPMRWDDAAEVRRVSSLGPFELIVGGDLLYRPQVVEPLLVALDALVGRRTTVLLAASLQHSPETIALFGEAAAEAGFVVERLGSEAQCAHAQSEEVKLLRVTRPRKAKQGGAGDGAGKVRPPSAKKQRQGDGGDGVRR